MTCIPMYVYIGRGGVNPGVRTGTRANTGEEYSDQIYIAPELPILSALRFPSILNQSFLHSPECYTFLYTAGFDNAIGSQMKMSRHLLK